MYYVCIWLKNYCIKKTICIRCKHENLRNYIKISRVSTTKKNTKSEVSWREWCFGIVEGGPPKMGPPNLKKPTGHLPRDYLTQVLAMIAWGSSKIEVRKPIQNPRNKWCVDKFAGLLSAQHNQITAQKVLILTSFHLFPSPSPSQLFPAHKTSWYCRHLHLIHQEQRFLPTTFLIKAVGVCFQWHNDRGVLLVFVSKHTRCFSNMMIPMIGGWSLIFQQQTTRYEIGNPAVFSADIRKIPWRISRMSCGWGGQNHFMLVQFTASASWWIMQFL